MKPSTKIVGTKFVLMTLLLVGSIVFYFVFADKTHQRESIATTPSEFEEEFKNNVDNSSLSKEHSTTEMEEKKNTAIQTNPTDETPASTAHLVDLSGIDKDFRECLQTESGWASEIKDNLHGFSALKNELVRVLGAKDLERETYREKTIQLPNGEKRVVHMDLGSSDSLTGNNVYWSKQDESGELIPEDLPIGFDPDNSAEFDKLVSQGEVKNSTSTKVIAFKNGVEISVVEVNGETTSVSVQTEDHQSFCQLDPAKGYHCDCVY
jgi:hypothetical protein